MSLSKRLFNLSFTDLYLLFDMTGANRIVDLERVTNHDVKAVEYYLKVFFLFHEFCEWLNKKIRRNFLNWESRSIRSGFILV